MSSQQSNEGRQGQRLQKVLAAAGLGSRRQCEELILAGRIEVDRATITELGTRVDPQRQRIRVDGVALRSPERIYYAVHKPAGVLSTSSDQWRRARVIDLVDSDKRLFTVGRLDQSSTGLILLTNDGELANRLAHPRYQVEKTYHVTVVGRLQPETVQRLRRGVRLAEGLARPVDVRIKRRLTKATVLEIVLAEGRNREIRRMLAKIGHKVLQLRRVALGPIRLGDLPPGGYRELSRDELRALRSLARVEGPRNDSRRRKARPARHEPGTRRQADTNLPPSKRRGVVLTGSLRASVKHKTGSERFQKRVAKRRRGTDGTGAR
jgi:23S rRNA pseudouridine2605 synthase